MKTEFEKLEAKFNRLKKELDKLKEEKTDYQSGKWYNTKNGVGVFFITSFSSPKNYEAYGIGRHGNWVDESQWVVGGLDHRSTEASEEQVEEMLMEEVNKRGIKAGAKVLCLRDDRERKIGHTHGFYPDTNELWVGGACVLMEGKWASIIEDKVPEIRGHKVELKDGRIKIGCNNGVVQQKFKSMVRALDHYGIKHVYHPDVNCVSVDKLKEIVDYLDK